MYDFSDLQVTIPVECKNRSRTCSLHLKHQPLLNQNKKCCMYMHGHQNRKLCLQLLYVHLILHVASRPVAVRLYNNLPCIVRCPEGQRPLPRRASVDSLDDFQKPPALYRHSTMPGQAPCCALTVAVEIGNLSFSVIVCISVCILYKK